MLGRALSTTAKLYLGIGCVNASIQAVSATSQIAKDYYHITHDIDGNQRHTNIPPYAVKVSLFYVGREAAKGVLMWPKDAMLAVNNGVQAYDGPTTPHYFNNGL